MRFFDVVDQVDKEEKCPKCGALVLRRKLVWGDTPAHITWVCSRCGSHTVSEKNFESVKNEVS